MSSDSSSDSGSSSNDRASADVEAGLATESISDFSVAEGGSGGDQEEYNAIMNAPTPQIETGPVDPGVAGTWDTNEEGELSFTESTDTITNFSDNLSANLKSNPLGYLTPTSTLLRTAAQTVAANAMLGNIENPFSIGGSSGVDFDDISYDYSGDSETQSYLAPLAPYAVGGTPIQESQVSQFDFSNYGLSSDLENDYNTAKANVANTMAVTPLTQQFGYSTAPYGALTAQNTGTNPFNIPYLQTRGLI